jgi:DNA-binding NarL/FixJ family response regulator
LVEELAAETVVLDVAAAGPAFVRELTDWRPELRVIAFALVETPPNVIEWAEAGVAGFVTEVGTVADLREAVVGAAYGELFCSPLTAGTLLRRVRTLAPGSLSDASLSPREVEIARLMEQGLMNKEIASRLGIELPTVKNHVHRILGKLGVHRRADAAARIRRSGLALRD